jgi:Family of unknown function (DUF6090)
MAKLFNKIRKQLVSEKPSTTRTTNYIKYAIGEIILVVIGILIALSINNWNEQRKYKNLEISMLTEINASLKENINQLNTMLDFNGLTLNSYSIILNHLDKNIPYNDSLENHFGLLSNWESPFFNYSAYETLKAKGVELISNTDLKKKIIRTYERDLEYLVNDYDKSEWNYHTSVLSPFVSKNFENTNFKSPRKTKPNNYIKLKNNPEFKNILKSMMRTRIGGIRDTKELKLSLENLVEEISKEINKDDD